MTEPKPDDPELDPDVPTDPYPLQPDDPKPEDDPAETSTDPTEDQP